MPSDSRNERDNHKAVAHWTEVDDDGRVFLCADTRSGRTVVVEVTDSKYGGEIRND